MATVVGALVAADGRSPFTTAMLALNTTLTRLPYDDQIEIGNFLPFRNVRQPNYLITQISIPTNVKLAYEYVARSPSDLPIVCVAIAQWPSGRTRVALGGFGDTPLLAMDGPESDGADIAAQDAFREAGDQWSSAEYRSEVAGTLTTRALERLGN